MPETLAQAQAIAERAPVALTKLGGRGVLVRGGIILTATHGINFNTAGDMALGGFYVEDVLTATGELVKAGPLAVEPVSDVAGSPRLSAPGNDAPEQNLSPRRGETK